MDDLFKFYGVSGNTIEEFEGRFQKTRKELHKLFRRYIASVKFLSCREWHEIRYRALKAANGRCACCGRGAKDGVVLNVDHIKPRKMYPELALDLANLQVLCGECNCGKGNWDESDWRA